MSDIDAAVDQALAGEAPGKWYIMDRNALPPKVTADGREVQQHREHEVAPGVTLRFHHDRPTPVPEAIALLMLKNPAFRRTDATGQELVFKNPPKQLSELEAGEQLKLTPNETIASLDELNAEALKVRAARLPGGDKMVRAKKEDIIAFIVETVTKMEAEKAGPAERNRNSAEDFMPQAETDDFFTNDG